MKQARDIRDAVQPNEILFVIDAMIGQDAVHGNDQPSGTTDEAPQIVGQSPTVDENEIEHDA